MTDHLQQIEKQIKELHSLIKKQNQTIETLMQPKQPTPKQLAMMEQIKKEHELAKSRPAPVRTVPGSKGFKVESFSEDEVGTMEFAFAAVTPTHYYLQPWANVGDIGSPIPETIEPSVNYPQGWTGPYSLPYPSNPDALAVTRTAWNRAMLDATLNIQEYQQWGTPNFISTSDNGGSPFSYSMYAFALYDDGVNGPRVFQSQQNTNTDLPSNAGAISVKWFLSDFTAKNTTIPGVTFSGGVTGGQAVYFNGTAYAAAVANGTSAQHVVGFADVANSRVISFGECALLTGLTAGATYYLSSATPGAITVTPPTTGNVFQVGTALSATVLSVAPVLVALPASVRLVTRVYSATSQTIGTTPTVINFDTVNFDATSSMNLTTHQFSPQIAGYYKIALSVGCEQYNLEDDVLVSLRKNGAAYTDTGFNVSVNTLTTPIGIPISDIVFLNGSTDYVDVVFSTTSGNGTVAGGTTATYFTAELISN